MALSNLEKVLIERLQEPQLDGERLIDGGLTAAANIVHEITRVQAPDDEAPADYIRRAVQEVSSDLTVGLALAVNTYKKHSGFEFNTQSGTPTDYLIEMAKRHKQLFEAPQAVDIRPGMEQAAMLVSSRAGMPLLPTETNEFYLVRVADQLRYALTTAERVNNCDAELIDVIANRACVRAMRDDQTDVDFIKHCLDEIYKDGYAAAALALLESTGIVPEFNPAEFKSGVDAYLKQIAELINKNKKPE